MTTSRSAPTPEHTSAPTPAVATWRPSTVADRESITALCLSLYDEDPGLNEMTPSQIHRTLDAFAKEPLRGQAVVLELPDGTPIGYALLVPFYSNELGGISCDVDELYVLPAHRSRGHGSALFARIEEGAFGAFSAISLITTPANARARQLYERLGFRLVGNTFSRPL